MSRRTAARASYLLPETPARLILGIAVGIAIPAAVVVAGEVFTYPRVVVPALLTLPGVVAAVLVGHLLPGMISALAAGAGLAIFFMPPEGTVTAENLGEVTLVFVVFMLVALAVAYALASASVARRTAEAAESDLRLLIDGAKDTALFMLDAAGRVASWNAAAKRLFGYDRSEVLGGGAARFFLQQDVEAGRLGDILARAVEEGAYEEDGWLVCKDEERIWTTLALSALRGADGALYGFALVVRDMTERKRLEDELAHLARHDGLTGLPNRMLLVQQVESALARAERHHSHVALLFLDLDDFKAVNDSLGHSAGDRLLLEVARRLRDAIRQTDSVARLGGDEFTILCEDVTDRDEVALVADRMLDRLRRPIVVSETEVFVSASVGAVLGESGDTASSLLRKADLAMYAAKEVGGESIRFWSDEIGERATERVRLRSALHHAIERDELVVLYQPQVQVATGRVVAVEALVRWQHPVRGLLPPSEFVPLAEETGLMTPLTAYVLATACEAAKLWPGEPAPVVGVNVPPSELGRTGLLEAVDDALCGGLEPGRLCLEITEATLMHELASSIAVLDTLSGRGIRLAIDDFGTGHSSLSNLKHIPVSTLKADSSFVRGLGRRADDAAIVAAIVGLGRALEIDVVAEGVETEEQLEALERLGCETVQGYYFARPMPAESLGDLLGRPLQLRSYVP